MIRELARSLMESHGVRMAHAHLSAHFVYFEDGKYYYSNSKFEPRSPEEFWKYKTAKIWDDGWEMYSEQSTKHPEQTLKVENSEYAAFVKHQIDLDMKIYNLQRIIQESMEDAKSYKKFFKNRVATARSRLADIEFKRSLIDDLINTFK